MDESFVDNLHFECFSEQYPCPEIENAYQNNQQNNDDDWCSRQLLTIEITILGRKPIQKHGNPAVGEKGCSFTTDRENIQKNPGNRDSFVISLIFKKKFV